MFVIGDKVSLKPGTSYHHQAPNLIGEIIDDDSPRWYTVIFSNNYRNNYPESDLVFVSGPPLPAPDMELDEIHLAQDLVRDG